jgi:hypothetical protein
MCGRPNPGMEHTAPCKKDKKFSKKVLTKAETHVIIISESKERGNQK